MTLIDPALLAESVSEAVNVAAAHGLAYERISHAVSAEGFPAPYMVQAAPGNPQVRIELSDRIALAQWQELLGVNVAPEWIGDEHIDALIFAHFPAAVFDGMWARLACHELIRPAAEAGL